MNAHLDSLRRAGAGLLATVLAGGCVTAPRPTAEAVRRSANPPAVVEGIVRDAAGLAVSGLTVRGLPRSKDLPWSPSSVTDGEGRFRLVLVAPGEYGFLLSFGGISVVTPRPDDPTRTVVSLRPGERRTGISLVFRREDLDGAIRSPHPPGTRRPS